MKSKCSFILKASTALVLALLMLFGSVSAILSVISGPDAAEPETVVQEPAKSAYVGGESPSSERGIRDLAGTGAQTDIVDTGAKVDIAATGYESQTGARFYLNAYNRWGDNVQDYVYLAIVRDNNQYASIIKMDHIANTYLYTCVTSSSNMEAKTDVGYIFFFTSSNSGWATKMSGKKDNWYDNVNSYKGTGGMITTSYGMDIYNNHVYYMSINSGNDGVTIDHNESDGNNLAGSTSHLKASQQKASVYVSTTDRSISSASYASSGSVGGDVQVTGYYWDTNFTVAKTTATSSKTNSSSSKYYSYYDNAAMTSWITMKVNEVYDGWTFVGWYDGSTLKSSETTYYYKLTSSSSKDIKAFFFKPTYDTTATPAPAETVDGPIIIINKGSNSDTPTNLHIWDVTNGSTWSSLKTLSGTDDLNIKTYSFTKQGTSTPKAIVLKGNTTTGDDNNKLTDTISCSSALTDDIYYYSLPSNKTSGTWLEFSHLGVTLSGNPATADPGDEITLTATKSGTLESGAKLNYYFQKNGEGSWYRIGSADTTSATMNFYPPDYGSYTFKVTVTDTAGLETAVAASTTTTNVGPVGFYVSGDTGLVGSNWGVAPYKGYMTTPASGTIYTKTFGNVAAGTYGFRITSLTNWVTDSSTHGEYTVDGSGGSMNGNNFTFTISDKKQITITYDSSNHNVTVTTAEVQAIDVVVYAGPGGSVEVTYGTAHTEIPENENATIKVAYGDKIDLEATEGGGTTFSKWYKNLEDDYKGGKASEYDSLEDEVITQRTVYVACFSGGSGSWVYSADRSNASPEISGEPSDTYNIIYSNDDDGPGRNKGTPHGEVAAYISGSDYWCDLTSIFGNPPSTPTTLYIALANGTGNNNMVGDSNTKINGSTYSDNNGPVINNASGETLFTVRKKQNNTVHSSIRYIEISGIDWSKISALGVRAVYTGSGSVNYKFYYKLSGATAASSTYIPSTNYYAKDASIRNVTGETPSGLQYNFWIYPTRTEVKAVDGQVSVSADHASNDGAIGGHNQWVEGFALKGSQITVTTIIPHRGSYNVTNSSGVTSTVSADEKYYVKGFSFNGVTPELLSESSGSSVSSFSVYKNDGTTWTGSGTAYSCTYTIPADMKEAKLEITPILFVKDAYASNTVMVYLNGYNDSVKNAGWGNTLYVYPFYQYYKDGSSGDKGTYYGQGENFGRYPGQPVINYGGQLFMQIPLSDDASKDGKDSNGGQIKGITINNGYYDYVHKDCCSHVSVHRQTYDYDDFAKIYNQKKMKDGEKYLYSIYFSFKYFPENSTKQHRLNTTTSTITADGNASRYNDLLSDSAILSDTTGTVASSTLITAGDNSTGWQDLEDALGNDVDIFGNKVTNASAEPLRVFSLGYEKNNSGKWATEWAVYRLNGANYELIYDGNWGIDSSSGHNNKYYNSSIVPSALIYNDKASLAAATSLDGDQPISGYAGLYENLEAYRGIPVKICYEHDIPDAFSPKNYRCDGRWTYTTVDDFVRSNIKIEYYDKDGILHDDTIPDGSHVGTTTGCSAYFTNSEYYGATTSTSQIINNAESYTFKAENKGSYEFAGWYLYDTAGHESTITKTDLEADTPRSGNFVLAARFKYIASGSLVISNSLAAGNTGRAITYLGVTIRNGSQETVLESANTNTEPVTINKSVINASSNYEIEVTVRTVPIGENTFSSYACYTTDGHTGTDVRSAASNTAIYNSSNSAHTTDTYTFNVKGDIFDSTTTNQQNVKAIEYISTLNAVHYTYNVKFNYTSRKYGDQAFTKSGELTVGQINDDTVVTGTTNTADKKLTEAFLASIAPHESNFNDTISWDFGAVVNSQSCTYTPLTNTYAITLTIGTSQQTHSSDLVRHGYFTVPYAQTDGIATAVGSKVAKTGETTFNVDANYDNLFKISGNFVTAPAVIYETVGEDEHERYFKYWEISTAAGKRGDSRVIGKCYYPEFNYRALDNYNVRAVYSVEGERLDGSTDNTSSPIISANSFAQLYGENSFTTIDFIGNTRNQWNNDDHGSHSYYAGDLIYNDFILTFKPQSMDLIKDLTDNVDCGFVIQRLKEIETNASGTNAKTLQDYAKDYTAADLDTAKAAAKTMAGGSTTEGYTQIKVTINKNDINNKNRCHYAYAMWNTNQKTSGGPVYPSGETKSNTKYLYRAYSYMKIGTGEYIMSEVPTYFYMYDIARE